MATEDGVCIGFDDGMVEGCGDAWQGKIMASSTRQEIHELLSYNRALSQKTLGR